MLLRLISIIILIYVFAVAQNSFFAHFSIMGIAPNLVLIFYFLVIFFSTQNEFYSWENYFWAVYTGLLLDVFSHNNLGTSVILLLIIMYLVKKSLQLLWERSKKYSIIYFVNLFIVSLIFYWFFSKLDDFIIDWRIFIVLAYNLALAVLGFFVFEKLKIFKGKERQLKLFK